MELVLLTCIFVLPPDPEIECGIVNPVAIAEMDTVDDFEIPLLFVALTVAG